MNYVTRGEFLAERYVGCQSSLLANGKMPTFIGELCVLWRDGNKNCLRQRSRTLNKHFSEAEKRNQKKGAKKKDLKNDERLKGLVDLHKKCKR